MSAVRFALLWAAAFAATPAGTAGAQVFCTSPTGPIGGPPATCATPTTLTATMTAVTVGRLAINAASTAIMSGVNVSIGDYEASEDTLSGSVFTGPRLDISANKAYSVTFTNPAVFSLSPNAKTAAHVKYSVSGTAGTCASPYAALSTSGATQSVGSGAATALKVFQVCFRVKWIWATDPPGTYRLPVTFTLTAP